MTIVSVSTDIRNASRNLVTSPPLCLICFMCLDKKRGDKREKLLLQEQNLKTHFIQKQQIAKEAHAILIEGFPKNYNQLMLQELVRSYPGLQEYSLQVEKQTAVVKFSTHDDAEVALAGNTTSDVS